MADPAGPYRLRRVENPDRDRWGDLIGSDPRANPLQFPAVQVAVASGIRDARPLWYEVEDEAGLLVAGLPVVEQSRWGLRKIVSGASGLYGGPVVRVGAEGAAPLLARAFDRAGGVRAVRRELVWSGRRPPAGEWRGLRPLPTSVLRIDPDADFEARYEEGLRPARRKERRRLQRAGYRVELEAAEQGVAAFCGLHGTRCREWGVRPFPESCLRALLASGPEWKFFVVRSPGGEFRGAHVCIDLGDELFAWLGTTERVEGGSLATLLVESELRWCHALGRQVLNLGTSADLGGVSEFKRGISAEEDPRWILRWQRGRGYR